MRASRIACTHVCVCALHAHTQTHMHARTHIHTNTLSFSLKGGEQRGTSVCHATQVLVCACFQNWSLVTGWRRCIGCLKFQISFCKIDTNYKALLRIMTYKDMASYASSPPCIKVAFQGGQCEKRLFFRSVCPLKRYGFA